MYVESPLLTASTVSTPTLTPKPANTELKNVISLASYRESGTLPPISRAGDTLRPIREHRLVSSVAPTRKPVPRPRCERCGEIMRRVSGRIGQVGDYRPTNLKPYKGVGWYCVGCHHIIADLGLLPVAEPSSPSP